MQWINPCVTKGGEISKTDNKKDMPQLLYTSLGIRGVRRCVIAIQIYKTDQTRGIRERVREDRTSAENPATFFLAHEKRNLAWADGRTDRRTGLLLLSHRPNPLPTPTPPCAVRHWYWKLWVGAPSLSLRLATKKTGSCPDADGDDAMLRKTFAGVRRRGAGTGTEKGRSAGGNRKGGRWSFSPQR